MQNKALLVGINKYPDPRNELRGCVNDILDMEYFISEKNKVYDKQNIKKLTDKAATKNNIVEQIKWLVNGAQAGDQLLFHYSGHGAQAPTLFNKLEQDGLDEIICPYDYNGSNETTLRDKEFAHLFAGIPKGVHFIWISDSCHAEDLSRDPQPLTPSDNRYRYFSKAGNEDMMLLKGNTSPLKKLFENLPPIIAPLNGALLSACESHELSADAYINNKFNGAFTYYLIKNLIEYGNSKPMNLIVQLVNRELQHNGYDQSPQTEGLLENANFFI